jgi:hypothetical protein
MNMKKAILAIALFAMAAPAVGCGYAGVGTVGTDKVVIARNDGFLFGILRKVFVCKVTDAGLSACSAEDAP